MTSNGFDILLILVERIKIDIALTWENIERTTGRVEKELIKDNESPGRICK